MSTILHQYIIIVRCKKALRNPIFREFYIPRGCIVKYINVAVDFFARFSLNIDASVDKTKWFLAQGIYRGPIRRQRATAGTYKAACCARKIAKNFLSYRDLRPCARDAAWHSVRANPSRRNQWRPFPRIRFPPTSTGLLLFHRAWKNISVKSRRGNGARTPSWTQRQDLESNSLDNLAWRFASRDQSIQLI